MLNNQTKTAQTLTNDLGVTQTYYNRKIFRLWPNVMLPNMP